MMKKLLCAFLVTASAVGAVYADKVTIVVSDFQFNPESVSLQLGDTVVFQWSNGFHTATSTDIPEGAASFDETLSEEADEFVYVPTVAGAYNYVCTPHIDMGMDGIFTVEMPAGITDQQVNALDLRVWPNPADAVLNLSVDHNGGLQGTVALYNMAGQQVLHTPWIATGQETYQVAIDHLPAGMYAVRLVTELRIAQRLFVVQR